MGTQVLNMYVKDETNDLEMRIWINHGYGDGFKALWTIFKLTFSGGWPQWCDALVVDVHAGWGIFFSAYIVVVTFAIFRIITALFIQETMKIASSDDERMLKKHMDEKNAYIRKLRNVFLAADTSGDGNLNYEELHSLLANNVMRAYLALLDLSVLDVD